MKVIELDMYQALGLAVVMLVFGRLLVGKIKILGKYCIPAPVVGGLVFAVLHVVLRSAGIVEFNLDTTLQNVFMTAFFCSVGYMAAFGELKKGGIGVIKFLFLSVLGGDEHHTAGCTDTVCGCRSRIFQDRDGLNLIRTDVREGADDPVHNHQDLAVAGTRTADVKAGPVGTRLSAVLP